MGKPAATVRAASSVRQKKTLCRGCRICELVCSATHEGVCSAQLSRIHIAADDLDRAGDRIRNLNRALHIRNYDRSRAVDETTEWVFEYPEKSDGTRLDRAQFDSVLDRYYENRGWNAATGRPTRAKLEQLGLKDVADELERLGKLS